MSTIGGQTFDIIRGLPQLVKQRSDVWEVPGIDGYGVQTLGLGDAEFQLVGVAYVADGPTADRLIYACNALQGTVVDITDDWGVEYYGILVRHIDTTDGKKPCYSFDGNTVRVEIHWTMIATVVI